MKDYVKEIEKQHFVEKKKQNYRGHVDIYVQVTNGSLKNISNFLELIYQLHAL